MQCLTVKTDHNFTSLIYFSARDAAMALRTAWCGYFLILLTVTCALGQNNMRHVCALRGSSVDLPCPFTYPDQVTENLWYSQWGKDGPTDLKVDQRYAGRVEYRGTTAVDCVLKITDLRESDKGEYFFRYKTDNSDWTNGTEGVALSIKAVLRCHTACSLDINTTFIWYKNGQLIPNTDVNSTSLYLDPVSSEDAGRYSCAVKGHQNLRSTEGTLAVRYGPKNTLVSVSSSGGLVVGSSVTLTCSSDANPPVDIYTWYFNDRILQSGFSNSYHVANFSFENSGRYLCEAINQRGSTNSSIQVTVSAVQASALAWTWVGLAVLAAGASLLVICCILKRRAAGGRDAVTFTHRVLPDNDTYAGLSMETWTKWNPLKTMMENHQRTLIEKNHCQNLGEGTITEP
uniref:Ig-like domain-containing protein n=1 Tax=Esox lucius TaxID=8010 RepID=A0A6Q2XFS0_ESOLU